MFNVYLTFNNKPMGFLSYNPFTVVSDTHQFNNGIDPSFLSHFTFFFFFSKRSKKKQQEGKFQDYFFFAMSFKFLFKSLLI